MPFSALGHFPFTAVGIYRPHARQEQPGRSWLLHGGIKNGQECWRRMFFGEKMNINHRGHQQHHHQHHSITFYHKYSLLEGIPCVCDFFLSEPVTRVQFLTMSKIRLVWVRMSIATCHTVVVLYLATGFLQLSLQCSPRHTASSCPKQEGRSQKYMQLVAGLLGIFSMR